MENFNSERMSSLVVSKLKTQKTDQKEIFKKGVISMPKFSNQDTGLECDISSIAFIHPVMNINGKRYFRIFYKNGHRKDVSLIDPESHPIKLDQVYEELTYLFGEYRS